MSVSHNMYCAVRGCRNNRAADEYLRFVTLPGEPNRKLQWLTLIGREDLLEKNTRTSSYRICAVHFPASALLGRCVKKNAVPSLHLPKDIRRTYTVETQTETKTTIMREAQTQTNDIGLPPIPLLNAEFEEDSTDESADEVSSVSDDIETDHLLDLEIFSEALMNVKIPIYEECDKEPTDTIDDLPGHREAKKPKIEKEDEI